MTATEIGAAAEAPAQAAAPAAAAAPGAGGPAAAPAPPPAPASAAPHRPGGALRVVALTMSLLGMLLVGFILYLYGLSSLSEAHAQSTLYKTFAGQLGAATAPTGTVAEGSPVAILGIPNLGISDLVVVEGATSADLTHGPGLLPSSAFPGQPGTSVIYGRAATFGGPFAHLMTLNRGERITVVTGEGTSVYSVESFGDSAHPAVNPAGNQLVLYTADSSILAGGYEQVTADLVTQPMASDPGANPAASAQEQPMAADTAVATPLILWFEALAAVVIGAGLLARHWSAPMVLLYATPAALALAWAVYENLAIMLPNLY